MSDEAEVRAEITATLPHYEVRVFLGMHEPGPAANERVAELLGLPKGPAYSTDLLSIIAALTEAHCWWSMSHLRAEVCPTVPAPGLEGVVSNGARYDKEGRPVMYSAMFFPERPAWGLCEAWIKAVYDLPDAFFVEASKMQKVIASRLRSRREMMSYYRAREDHRQQDIRRWYSRHPEHQGKAQA